MRTRRFAAAAGLLAALAAAAGCDAGPRTGEVTGTVTVDGRVPAEGSSISFIPADGGSPTAGDLIENGRYAALVPVGTAKVQIRVPRPVGGSAGPAEGPEGDVIEESLPERYNDRTELTFEVKSGRNEKNWAVSAKE
jgi:hypothetical protein